MKSHLLLKTTLLIFAPLLWLSCSSWEEVTAPDEFKPLKITSIAPMTAKTGDTIVITGENFIKNKEYNQVWFGGNIRGIIDSATATKLFLKVPDGAQSGNLSVSNGMYADTLKSTFTVVKESPFKTASLLFGGFKIIETTSISSFSNGSGNSTYTRDTIIYPNKTLTIIKSSFIPSIQNFSNYFSRCHEVNFTRQPDSVMQDFEQGKNIPTKYAYISLNLDSTNQVLKELSLFYGTYLYTSEINGSGYRNYHTECDGIMITLTNIPYNKKDDKIFVKLNADILLKHTNVFSGNYGLHRWTDTGRTLYDLGRGYNGIYQILPDAYFELTLE